MSNSSSISCFCSGFKYILEAIVSTNLSAFSISSKDTKISGDTLFPIFIYSSKDSKTFLIKASTSISFTISSSL